MTNTDSDNSREWAAQAYALLKKRQEEQKQELQKQEEKKQELQKQEEKKQELQKQEEKKQITRIRNSINTAETELENLMITLLGRQ